MREDCEDRERRSAARARRGGGLEGAVPRLRPGRGRPAQLAAVVVGDDATRAEAWWNLWGNILHQGTVYEATVPAVPILFALARWRDHPDREQAISMLRESGAAEGVDVWRYDADGAIVEDPRRARRLLARCRPGERGAEPLLDRWREEPAQPVQRELLWLLSVLPACERATSRSSRSCFRRSHRAAWELETARAPESQEDADAVSALEDWIHARRRGLTVQYPGWDSNPQSLTGNRF